MAVQTEQLFLVEDLDDASKTKHLEKGDLAALHSIADWVKTFVVRPNKEIGRAGAVCPFVPHSLELRTLWLAAEHIAGFTVPAVAELMNAYKRTLLDTRPKGSDDGTYNVIVVVFPDLAADRAKSVFDGVLEQLAVPSYVEDGILFRPYYEGNKGTALYNASFRPFQSPVPFLFVRHGVVSDWKFFLDDDAWLGRWAHRYGEAGARALAAELRRLPWRGEGHEHLALSQ